MGRPDPDLADSFAVIRRSFLGGCFGCLGFGSATIVAFVVIFVFFQPQVLAILKVIPIPLVQSLRGQATVQPLVGTPPAELPAIEVFITRENSPDAARITQLKVPVQEPIFLWARGAVGVAVHFSVRITLPTGQTAPFDGDLVTDATGRAVGLGAWANVPAVPGVFRIDAVIGQTIVGSTTLTLVSGA